MQNDVVDIDADYNGSIYKYMQSLGNNSKVSSTILYNIRKRKMEHV